MPTQEHLHHLKRQTQRLALWFGVALGILAGALVVMVGIARPTIQVDPTPAGATVQLDRVTLDAGTPHRVLPFVGTNVQVSGEGFFTYTKTLHPHLGESIVLKPSLALVPEPLRLSSAATGVSVDADAGVVYSYNLGNRSFERTRLGTTTLTEPISPGNIADFKAISWNPAHDLALLQRPNGNVLYDFHRYDLLHQEEIPINNDLHAMTWSPSGSRITAILQNAVEQQLIRATPTTAQLERLAAMAGDEPSGTLTWSPDGDLIALATPTKVRLFNLADHSWKDIGNLRGAVRFNPNGTLLMGNDPSGGVALYNRATQAITPFASNYTVEQVVFSDNDHLLLPTNTGWLERPVGRGASSSFAIRGMRPVEGMVIAGVLRTQDSRFVVFTSANGLYATELKGGVNG